MHEAEVGEAGVDGGDGDWDAGHDHGLGDAQVPKVQASASATLISTHRSMIDDLWPHPLLRNQR